ncbi:YolD-like family protein [Priestia koreensis]|uniref:YolD-like family protein n=1 Tax=Priestia koreensis TaxID=284581 RepID=UPI00203C71FE|nr:YolD-like family protein [Priestia koreensis]MCM3003249.1 YolD-like family protein [Priestia koreensis]
MKKWQPFAAIPEQFQGIRSLINAQSKIIKPVLEQDQEERMNYLLETALHNDQLVYLTYYHNGELRTEMGKIKKVMLYETTLQFVDTFNEQHERLLADVVDVQLI